MADCVFINNSAPKSWGGAIKCGSGTLTVSRNTFIKNFALRGNNIFAGNFSTFINNVFYMDNISDIKISAEDGNVFDLFDNNTFLINGNKISKDEYSKNIKK